MRPGTELSLAHTEAIAFSGKPRLRNAPITDAGLTHVVALPQLSSLYLEGTNVTETGARYLSKHRPDLHVHFP